MPEEGSRFETATSRAFGATVKANVDTSGLCFVAARSNVSGAVAAVGGRLIADLGNERALALIDLDGLNRLRSDPGIQAAGGVAIDPDRFARFCTLSGIQQPSSPH
jgi:hypothetical protein